MTVHHAVTIVVGGHFAHFFWSQKPYQSGHKMIADRVISISLPLISFHLAGLITDKLLSSTNNITLFDGCKTVIIQISLAFSGMIGTASVLEYFGY